MKIALSTESSSDLPKELVEKYSIHVIAFTIVKGEETIKDGSEPLENLYSFVTETKTLPRTTAVNIEEYKEHFSNLLKEYDAVVHVSMSHACSSAYENALAASKEFNSKVFVVDSLVFHTGPYGAGQNYGSYPVLCFDNVVSTITHCISGFAGLYVAIVGLLTLKIKNIKWVVTILFGFAILAYIADITIPYNYMFLMRGDGTPYDIFYDMVGGNPVLYPMVVMLLFVLYMAVVYGIAYIFPSFRRQAFEKEAVEENPEVSQ